MDLIQIAILGLQEAKELQKDCLVKGVEIVLNHNEQTCNRGCSVTVEVHARKDDMEIIQSIYSSKYQKILAGHVFDVETINSIYDSSAESVTCPACGHVFSPVLIDCPDCGLVLGGI